MDFWVVIKGTIFDSHIPANSRPSSSAYTSTLPAGASSRICSW